MRALERVRRLRAEAQALAGGARESSAEAVVRRVFAIQAQDATAAGLGIRVRGRDVTPRAVRTACEDCRAGRPESHAGAVRPLGGGCDAGRRAGLGREVTDFAVASVAEAVQRLIDG